MPNYGIHFIRFTWKLWWLLAWPERVDSWWFLRQCPWWWWNWCCSIRATSSQRKSGNPSNWIFILKS